MSFYSQISHSSIPIFKLEKKTVQQLVQSQSVAFSSSILCCIALCCTGFFVTLDILETFPFSTALVHYRS